MKTKRINYGCGSSREEQVTEILKDLNRAKTGRIQGEKVGDNFVCYQTLGIFMNNGIEFDHEIVKCP